MIYLKYILSGAATKIHSIIFIIICIELFHIPISISYVLTFIYSVCFNFLQNTRWVFHTRGHIFQYLAVVSLMLCINFYLFKFLLLHIHYTFAVILVSCITYPIHFILNQKFVFHPSKHDQ
jgi:putative flippase GtrA